MNYQTHKIKFLILNLAVLLALAFLSRSQNIKAQTTNLDSCNTLAFTISNGSTPTPSATSTPTSSPSPTSTSTPTQTTTPATSQPSLPQAGIALPTLIGTTAGALLLILALTLAL